MSTWTRDLDSRHNLLPCPNHDQNRLPVARRLPLMRLNFGSMRAQPTVVEKPPRIDTQILVEFRAKLRVAEDLISKLAYSLHEIQGMRKKAKEEKKPSSGLRTVGQVIGRIGQGLPD